ncbi:alanine dehydrogenase [Sulfuricella denitrificans skB26]|uniref:Alanine dehydrogenase n=1 Tax=Sulfuricella denitrificans (strain DSM 22764 / NBRC 105220 / skB26) TaxID=1163617 RepID=S6ACR5_SULDS|nr:alanine dehydrogenase [Sulfuricella denitrificans]BAN35788.1 alanine dehydrogenase [Sulfuricella denitrificans skB26]
MLIGVPKEIKDHEYRVGITPAGVRALTDAGHEVLVETRAGERIGFSDELYLAAGARIADSASEAYACPLIVKVKEPQSGEIPLLREGQVLFTYLHLAADPTLTRLLLESRIVAIAYETVSDAAGALPLLTPMSEVAGRISIQAGATALQLANGGRGVLLGGVPGVVPGKVLILGGGTVGTHAAMMALGLGADVTLMDISLPRLRYLDEVFGTRLKTRYSDAYALEELAREADLLVGSVLLPGKRAPKLISRALVKQMQPGSVLVDVAIDQGGCAETSRPTTHSSPTYIEEGVVHYCVANMPAACARSATQALTNATLPYVLAIADKGWKVALKADAGLRKGLNLHLGQVTHAGLASDLELPCISPDIALE